MIRFRESRVLRATLLPVLSALRAAFLADRLRWLLRLVPAGIRADLRLVSPPAGQRRVEIGSGTRPTPGYIHIDCDPGAPSLDLLARAHRLPLPDGWADEILTIHMIEHVGAALLPGTLAEFRRVLRSGGTLILHTPNGESLARGLLAEAAPGPAFWSVQAAIYGYGPGPVDSDTPEQLGTRTHHTVLLTWGALKHMLETAGFADVENITGLHPCYHLRDWETRVPGLCLEVRARA